LALLGVLVDRKCFSIDEFCRRQDISLSTFHKLQREGKGPRLMDISPIRISIEAEREWRAARDRPNDVASRKRDARVAAGRRAGELAVRSPRHVSKRRQLAAQSHR
jgi:hypothetical protein